MNRSGIRIEYDPASRAAKLLMEQDAIIRTLMDQRHSLLGYILAIVRDFHLAEDVFQESLVQATKHEGEFETKSHLAGWFRTVARNRAIDLLRGLDRQPLLLDDQTLSLIDTAWEHDASPASDDLSEALELCLGKLTDRSKQMIEMRFSGNLNASEIAKETGVKPASVHQTLYRTYRQLQDCVTDRLAEEGESS